MTPYPSPPEARRSPLATWAAAAALLAISAGVLLLTLYARPQTDDLFRGYVGRDGVWAALGSYWMTWGSRWLGALIHLLAARDLPTLYTPLLVACHVSVAAAAAVATRTLAGVSWHGASLAGCGLLGLVYLRLREPGDFFYWGAGTIENLLPIAPMLLAVVLLTRPRTAAKVMGLLTVILAGGLHELVAIHTLGLCVAGAAIAWSWRHGNRFWWSAAATVALVHLAVILLSPGNAGRATHMAETDVRHPLVPLIVGQLLGFARAWLAEPIVLSASLLVAALPLSRPGWLERPALRLGRVQLGWGLLLPLALGAIVLVTVGAHAHSARVPMPGRTQGMLLSILTIGWFACVLSWSAGRFAHQSLATAAAIALLVSLVLAPRTEVLLRDLKTNAPRWAAAMDERDTTLRAAAAADGHARLVPLPHTPASFWDQAVINEPAHYRNYHTRHFYRLRSVVVEEH